MFPHYTEETQLLREEISLAPQIESEVTKNVDHLLNYFEKEYKSHIDLKDYSVYTGTSGISFLYYHLSRTFPSRRNEFLGKALELVEDGLKRLNKRRVSFYCGDAGPLALSAVIYAELGRLEDSNKRLEALKVKIPNVIDLHTDLPDEILYGRSGFLYALNFVYDNIKNQTIITNREMRAIIEAILKSGELTHRKEKQTTPPLMFYWHDKAYVGAAHGFAGIYYMLLKNLELLAEKELEELIKPSVDFILSLQFRSGNFPSSLGNDSDRLIHWCHGAPGVIHLMIIAYKIFGEEKYLASAKKCVDVIWERGLLTKGYGICHGVSGNAYAFLAMYQLTQNKLYLYRAIKFAEWCFNYGKHGCRTPDRPFSLFEGLAGTIYLLSDLLEPVHSNFPAFSR